MGIRYPGQVVQPSGDLQGGVLAAPFATYQLVGKFVRRDKQGPIEWADSAKAIVVDDRYVHVNFGPVAVVRAGGSMRRGD